MATYQLNGGVSPTNIGMKYVDGSQYYLGLTLVDSGRQTRVVSKSADNTGYIAFDTGASAAERMRIDSSGRVGIKTTPSAWGTDYGVLDLNTGGSIYGTTSGVSTASNLYFTGAAWLAKNTGLGTLYAQHTGKHFWYSSASVSAGSSAPLAQKMELDSSGVLDAVGGYKVNGTTVIDSSRNLTNIWTITATGVINVTAGQIDLASGYPIRWGGAASSIYGGSG